MGARLLARSPEPQPETIEIFLDKLIGCKKRKQHNRQFFTLNSAQPPSKCSLCVDHIFGF
jgi:hypothetical protein